MSNFPKLLTVFLPHVLFDISGDKFNDFNTGGIFGNHIVPAPRENQYRLRGPRGRNTGVINRRSAPAAQGIERALSVKTDDNGNYLQTGLEEGEYELSIIKDGHSFVRSTHLAFRQNIKKIIRATIGEPPVVETEIPVAETRW